VVAGKDKDDAVIGLGARDERRTSQLGELFAPAGRFRPGKSASDLVRDPSDWPIDLRKFLAQRAHPAMLFVCAWAVGGRRYKAPMATSAEVDAAIAKTAAQQHGLITRGQAIGAGVTNRMIQTRIASGRWERLERSVYRLQGSAQSWKQSLMAICLSQPAAVVSHSSAAALHQFPGFEEGPLEFTVPRGKRLRRLGIIVHETRLLNDRDVVRIGGIRVTAPHRTLLDLCATSPMELVEESLDDLVRRGLVSIPRMRWELEEYASNGRDGVDVMRHLLDARQPSVVPESVLETRVLRQLRRSGLVEPETQFAIRERGKILAIIDFAYPSHLIAIEVDGFRYHSGRSKWQRDLSRRNVLTARGWRVIHVTADDLKDCLRGVIQTIKTLLAAEMNRRG
jgi:very-short-patch-repair endonuclease